MQNVIAFGIKKEKAICCATYKPAKAIGMEEQIGSIAPGFIADSLACDADLRVEHVYTGGKRVF